MVSSVELEFKLKMAKNALEENDKMLAANKFSREKLPVIQTDMFA